MLKRYYEGEGVEAEDADTAVSTLTLVAALVLTIPFGMIGNFGPDYWSWLSDEHARCVVDGNNFPSARHMYNFVFNLLNTTIYSSISAIIMAMIYYLFRPKQSDVFQKWWFRGRWALVFILVAVAICIISIMTLSGGVLAAQWYVSFSGDLCMLWSNVGPWYTGSDAVDARVGRYFWVMGLGVGGIFFCLVSGFILML